MALAILEAMAHGLPVVATEGCYMRAAAELGALRECAQGGAALAAALAPVLADPAAARTLGAAGRRLYQRGARLGPARPSLPAHLRGGLARALSMCGIAGYFGDFAAELLPRMNQAQAHRGPDGQGVWSSGRVGLAHVRLAILDLSPSGHQPMSDARPGDAGLQR
jgi:hypothetical protein